MLRRSILVASAVISLLLAPPAHVHPVGGWEDVEETVKLLSARSPKLEQALRRGRKAGLHYLVLDGTLIHIDRIAADRPYFSSKHRVHGMNVQVIATPDGTILWTSGALPGTAHDLSAARIWGILHGLEKAGINTLADKAYQGAEGPVRTRTRARTSPSPRSSPTAPTPSSAGPANARTPS